MLGGDTVFEKLCELSEDANEAYLPYCELAAAVISEKLKSGADANDVRVVTAAAMLALSRYITVVSASQSEHGSVRVGDITVSSGSKAAAEAANAMLCAALSDAAELLSDTSFVFGVV